MIKNDFLRDSLKLILTDLPMGGGHDGFCRVSEVPDTRDFTARHELAKILFVAMAAVLAARRTARRWRLRQFVPLKHGAPSHDTFSRVLAALDLVEFTDHLDSPARELGVRSLGIGTRFNC